MGKDWKSCKYGKSKLKLHKKAYEGIAIFNKEVINSNKNVGHFNAENQVPGHFLLCKNSDYPPYQYITKTM